MLREIWTDGACSGNPGYGGWAATVDGELICDGFANTTNNAMELFAVYNALLQCSYQDTAVIFTDSRLVIGWLKKGWQCNNPINRLIIEAIQIHKQSLALDWHFTLVKGHSGSYKNNLVDRAAHDCARRKRGGA